MTDGPLALLLGPLTGLAIYRRVARLRWSQSLGYLVLALLGVAVLGATLQIARFARKLDAMEQSSIAFMPRVNIEGGFATVEADPGRLIETDRVVILFDTRDEPAPLPPRTADDQRDRVLVGARALAWYRTGASEPNVLPWAAVNQMWGERVSVDGRELVERWRAAMPRTVLLFTAMVAGAVLAWELVLLGVLILLYGALFGRRLGVPGPRRLFAVGAVASWPALLVGATLALLIGQQEWGIVAHTVLLGGLFLLGANTAVGLPPDDAPDTPTHARTVASEL